MNQEVMNLFNPVLIQRFDNQTDAVFRCNRIAEFRKPVKMLDDKSTEGIKVFRFQFLMSDIQFQTIVQINETDRTFNDYAGTTEGN